MKLKTRAIGLLAAAGLALSLAGPAAAEEATGTASVTLGENQSAVSCTATLSGGDFGNATWNAETNRYEFDDGGFGGTASIGDSTLTVVLDYIGAFPGDTANCDAQITRTDFKDTSGAAISNNTFSLSFSAPNTTYIINVGTNAPLFSNVDPSVDQNVPLRLNLSNVTAAPESYSSTLTVTLTDHDE